MAEKTIFNLFVQGPEFKKRFQIKPGTSTLGREPSNTIQLNQPKVSRRHAIIECTETGCTITDVGSANGTVLNGSRIEANIPIELKDGDKILIDPFQLTFSIKKEKIEEKTKEEIPVEKEEPTLPPPMPSEPPEIIPEPEPETEIFSYPPGLSGKSIFFDDYLPGIFHTDFMSRFLAMFESIILPLEWNIENFDLFLNPRTAPADFLPWLSNWFNITFDSSWSEDRRRKLLEESSQIYARRGTRWALSRILEIYTGQAPEIIENEKKLDPFKFKVVLPFSEKEVDRNLIIRMIDSNKPAHTSYLLEFKGSK